MVHFHYNGLSHSGGIYIIFNTYNWRLYVGSCKRFSARWHDGHLRSLLNGRHSNKFLLADFRKCRELLGNDDFLEFHIVENLPDADREQRLEAEERWLKLHFDQGVNCYNATPHALSRDGSKDRTPQGERKRRSEATKRMWQDPEYRAKLLKAVRGRKHSEETKKKMSAWHKASPHNKIKGVKRISAEQKELLRLANLGNKHTLGRKHTPETIEKMKILAKLRGNNNVWKFRKK